MFTERGLLWNVTFTRPGFTFTKRGLLWNANSSKTWIVPFHIHRPLLINVGFFWYTHVSFDKSVIQVTYVTRERERERGREPLCVYVRVRVCVCVCVWHKSPVIQVTYVSLSLSLIKRDWCTRVFFEISVVLQRCASALVCSREICIYICVHVYICVYMYVYICVCVCICIHICYIYVYVYICMHTSALARQRETYTYI